MRGAAHAVIGAAGVAAVAHFIGHTAPLVPLAALGAVGGLLPDVDHPHSTVGRYVPWPAVERPGRGGITLHGRRWFGGHIVWHRGETHSVGGMALAGLGAGGATGGLCRWARGAARVAAMLARVGIQPHPWAWAAWAASAVAGGYATHLVADTANRSPQMLWWPLSRRMVRPPWRGVAESSPAGHTVEWVVAAVAAVLLAVWR